MKLDTYSDPADIYTARGSEVNPNRPYFTGDVFRASSAPEGELGDMSMIVAHPCSFRVGSQLAERVLVVRVESTQKVGPGAWQTGYFDRMPLPNLDGAGTWIGIFSELSQAPTSELLGATRIACLSEIGINILQQRLTYHLTRTEIPTHIFNQAFSHTLEEADLLEDWTDGLGSKGWDRAASALAFETFMRAGDPSMQDQLLDAQRRSSVRAACKAEAKRLAAGAPTT